MDYIVFKQWLQDEKNLSIRSASDVVSRCKRVNRITKKDSIDDNTVTTLMSMDSYDGMSPSIKSQLKRAATLYVEFSHKETK